MTLQTAIVAMIVSAILYTIIIWSEKLYFKKLTNFLFLLFIISFISDVFGTTIMALMFSTNPNKLHIWTGRFAIFIMTIHFFWAVLAKWKYQKLEEYFHRFSIFAWFVWMVSLVTGHMLL